MKIIDTSKLQNDFNYTPCGYCASIHKTVMARVKAKNIFNDIVNVCTAHYKKWCDADMVKTTDLIVEWLNDYKNFIEHVPSKYLKDI